jgi:GNAT superfamily N-acetyltransferase
MIRPWRAGDAHGLVSMYDRLSQESRYRRFLIPDPQVSRAMFTRLLQVDHHDHESLVALAPDAEMMVGVARFIRDGQNPDSAEVAVTVLDQWQGEGLGSVLLERLAHRAGEEDIRYFHGNVLAENQAALELMRGIGEVETTRENGQVTARVIISGQSGQDRSPLRRLLRAAASGQFIVLPEPLRPWLDVSRDLLIHTLLVPVAAARRLTRTTPTNGAPGTVTSVEQEARPQQDR